MTKKFLAMTLSFAIATTLLMPLGSAATLMRDEAVPATPEIITATSDVPDPSGDDCISENSFAEETTSLRECCCGDLGDASTAEFLAMGDHSGNLTGATWYWPLHGYSSTGAAYAKISSSYGYRGASLNGFHRGVDIAVPRGTPVYPVRNGTVSEIHSSTAGNAGRYIVINHGDGYYSVYMHLDVINVSHGQSVSASTQIGAVGGSGYGDDAYYGYHLHLGIHYGSSFSFECNVNPCPSGYTRIGDSFKESAGGYPIGSASIAYALNVPSPAGATSRPNVSLVYPHTVEVTWSYDGNASSFDVYLLQEPWSWEDIKYSCTVTSGARSCTFMDVKPGEYCAFTIARPNADSVQSGWADFTVADSTANYVIIDDGVYCLSPVYAPDKRLCVANASLDEGANVNICPARDEDAQKFAFTHTGDGWYIIANVNSGKVLDLYWGGETSGTNVQQFSDSGSPWQRWRIVDAGDGSYTIAPKNNPALRLDVDLADAQTTETPNVRAWTAHWNANGKWIISPPVLSGSCGENVTWVYDPQTRKMTISGTGEIPGIPGGGGILADWHDFYKEVEEIVVEPGPTSIGDYLFHDFISLKRVRLPASVTKICGGAFSGCTSLSSINIPNGVTEIPYSTFFGCNGLTNINIPNSVTEIGNRAFGNCSKLAEISIPDSVTSIGSEAFTNTPWLEKIAGDFPMFRGHLLTYRGTSSSAVIPDGATAIPNDFFQNHTELEHIIIPESVTTIGSYAFSGCSGLTEITIPNSVTTIGHGAFLDCTNLKNVILPNSVTKLSGTFWGCTSLEGVVVPYGVTKIDARTFQDCKNMNVTIPESVTAIDESAFWDCAGVAILGVSGSYAQTFAQNNGLAFVPLSSMPKPELTVSIHASPSAKVTASVQNSGQASGSCILIVAAYDQDGTRLVAVRRSGLLNVPASGRVDTAFSNVSVSGSGVVWKAFLLNNGNLTPLATPAQAYQIQ